jgi:hypothetical protein
MLNVWRVALVCGLGLVACKVQVVDGDSGDDGSGGSPDDGVDTTSGNGGASTSGNGGNSVTTGTTNAAVTNGPGTTGSGGFTSCGDLPCDGSPDPTTNCIACTQDVNGDCQAEVTACTQECGAIFDCINACPDDNPATVGVDEFLSCVCTLNAAGTQCEATSVAGTCFGDSPGGVAPFIDLNQCFIDTCTDPSCG